MAILRVVFNLCSMLMKKTIVSLMVFAGLGLGSGSVLAVYVPYGDDTGTVEKSAESNRGYVSYEDTSTNTDDKKYTKSSRGYVPFYDGNVSYPTDTITHRHTDHDHAVHSHTVDNNSDYDYQWHRSSTYCPTSAFFARGDGYYASLGLRIPASLRSIQKYRVRRSDGQRSQRFVPGDDVDMSTGSPARGHQRMWAYFDVYDYEVTRCGDGASRAYQKRYVTPHYKPQVVSSTRNVIYPSLASKTSAR